MRWLREPLLHFVVIGVALFALFYQVTDQEELSDNRIVISSADTDRIATLFKRKWQRLPTRKELDGLVEAKIREEILYREALAMGLIEDDIIVRRRMAQKMEFLFTDLADAAEPTDEELHRFLSANSEKFEVSARTSFVHVYFSVDKRGQNVETDARRLLAMLHTQRSLPDPARVGDPFMVGYSFAEQSDHHVMRLFGAEFAKALSSVEVGGWRGPIASGYGLHLVYVQERTKPRLPPLAEIRDAVLYELKVARRLKTEEAFRKTLRERYTVVVERPQEGPERVTSEDSPK